MNKLFVLLLITTTAALLALIDAKCAHKRSDAIACAHKYCDLNKDGFIAKDEVEKVRSHVLYWYEKLGAFFKGESTDVVMERCDFDGDGLISRRDFDRSRATCLRDCDSINDFFKYICNRADGLKIE